MFNPPRVRSDGEHSNANIEGLVMGAGNDWAYGDNGSNYIYGQGGNDNLFGSNGADYIDGGAGFDYARFDDASYAGLTADLANIVAGTGAAAGDTYANVEGLILTNNADFGYGNSASNYLYGRGGNDFLDGRGGDDFLFGGTGNDTFRFATGYGRDSVLDFEGGTGTTDRIDLTGLGFSSFSQVLALTTQVGLNLELRLSGTDLLVIQNFQLGNFAADDVLI